MIAKKNVELQEKSAQAKSFDGNNPLSRESEDYKYSLAQYSTGNPSLVQATHNKWETAYKAALDAKLLTESIRLLSEKIQALSAHYAEQEIKWREIDAIHEGYRQHAERRQEQIQYKSRLDEDQRRDQVTTASTFTIPYSSAAGGAVVLGQSGALLG